MTTEVVYVLGLEGLSVVKIGMSRNLEMRLASLQTSAPGRLSVLWTTPGGRELEKRLHQQFAPYRTHGEWFDLTPLGDPLTVVQEAIRADGGPPPTAPQLAGDPDEPGRPAHCRALTETEAAALLVSEARRSPVVYGARNATHEELARIGISVPPGAVMPVVVSRTSQRNEKGQVVITEKIHPPARP